ncbi:MAG: alpha/beta hydrolase [Gammaproteobacteria bacterium]|nr:alpha/beta hydrolase [Rhodocyclaceae bacterium]MBU3908417.1 alpha/beta hydrolase [Gammaproteobacteria bacterium]MBU4005363.1 alpha/beta hydrolase [Gammaproteobacteria bacterium]MBU4021048.1 alpha/beta hydrolase [Gammaproteobacteria bacterium]MBU4096065.1 alpha/beta hydrolase [Gammaproteobacteria bacterium]
MFVELDGQPAYAVTGQEFDPALPCLVFIHGAQHDHFVWMQQIRHFAGRGYSILAVNLPGHGQSGGTPLASIEALADWLLALLVKVGAGGTAQSDPHPPIPLPEEGGDGGSRAAPAPSFGRTFLGRAGAGVTLIGHSMGSLIALEAAARAPELIHHLVLIGTALPMPVAPALLETAQKNEAAAMALINQWAHSPRGWRGAYGSLGQWLPGINLRIMERQKPGVLYNDLAACNAYENGPAAIALLACPVTLIAGKSDRMTSVKASRRLLEQLPDARLVELPAVGHAMMAEAPLAVNQAIAQALAPAVPT